MEHRDFSDWGDAVTYALRVYVVCGAHLTVRRVDLVWSAVWPGRLSIPWGDEHD